VIGMHRSGTTLLTRLLCGMGVFCGWRPTRNGESPFFGELNKWLLRQVGGSWDAPRGVEALAQDARVHDLVRDYLELSLGCPRVARYLGPGGLVPGRHLRDRRGPWGWKDPRNTFTLPVWRSLFPEARVIHVHRHGVDVAASLRHRRARALDRAERRYRRRRRLYCLQAKHGGFAHSLPCGRLDSAFAIWEAYVDRARDQLAGIGERGMEIGYEQLVASPEEALRRLADHCGLELPARRRRQVMAQIDAGRVEAFRSDPELVRFAGTVAGRLRARGYEA